MKSRNQWCSLTACFNILASEISNNVYSGFACNDVCVTQLQRVRVGLVRVVSNGLTVTANRPDFSVIETGLTQQVDRGIGKTLTNICVDQGQVG